MELISLEDFLNEKKDAIIKKKIGVNIPFTDIVKWFQNTKVKEFKSVSAFTKDFNAFFNVEIPSFSQLELKSMVEQGIIVRNGKKVEVGPGEPDTDIKMTTASATKVASLSKGKAKKLKIPQAKSESKYQDFLDTVLMNMLGESQSRLLLTGEPGSGKSRTVENVMSLLKMQVITVEAPHVSEEDIINIPYLVKRGNKIDAESSSFKETKTGFEVVQAESALITRLKMKKKITDNEYQAFLKKNKILIPLADDYKDTIDEIADKFATVLFLDEFYRSGSPRIQNLFRTILNGNLGNTPIPKNVYIIFASNMSNDDGSLDDIPLNHQFDKVNFDTPSKEDFLRYMADKFTNQDVNTGEDKPEEEITNDDGSKETTKVKNPITPEVYNAFADAFSAEDMGGKDPSTDIRISPRRWEEIMKYVNANIPAEDEHEVRQLLTFLRDNFKDYATEEVSSLYKKYEKVIKDLVKETSGIDATKLAPLQPSEWMGTLDSQIKTKIKLGEDRKYVPIISGMPGIGKTMQIDTVAKKYKLNKIVIDASTLNADDATGLTTPTGEGSNLTTEFSEPPLYTQIMKEYDKDKVPEEGSKYTHVLFIDELTRTSVKVFNTLRSLILDKKVGALKIPDDMFIVCAMNPKDTGAIELSEHFKDVVDVVDSEAKFSDVMDYIKNKKTLLEVNKKIGFDLVDISYNINKQLVERFESSETPEGEPIYDENTKKFYWTDGFNTFYISAREMDSAISGCVIDSFNILRIKKRFSLDKQYNESEVEEFVKLIEKTMLGKWNKVLGFITEHKADIASTDFEKIMIGVEDVIGSNMYMVRDGFTSVKSEALQSFKSLVDGANNDIDTLINYDGIVPILEKTIADSDTNTFINDVAEVIDTYVNFDDVYSSIDNLIGLWKLLAMVDWTQFNGEITASISDLFLTRGWNPFIVAITEDDFDDGGAMIQYDKDEEAGKTKYPGALDIIIDRAETNQNNMFVE